MQFDTHFSYFFMREMNISWLSFNFFKELFFVFLIKKMQYFSRDFLYLFLFYVSDEQHIGRTIYWIYNILFIIY